MQGVAAPPMMLSPRKTANGSSPTSARAQRMAWPSPSGSRWRTYDSEASSEMVLIGAKLVRLATVVQVVLELEGRVEVILDRALAAAGHDDDLRQTRGDRLLDNVPDHRLVDEREHLFRLRLGRGEEPRSEPSGGKDRLAHFHEFIIRAESVAPFGVSVKTAHTRTHRQGGG